MLLLEKAPFLAAACLVLMILYPIVIIIYNIFLHPLRNVPGPLLMRATRFASAYKLISGTLPFDMLDLHNRYGEIVRIAPNELAFSNEKAWREIMGHRTKGSPEFIKSPFFYNVTGGPRNIVSANGAEHAMLRKQLSHGFSDKSLTDQQPIVMPYINSLISSLHGRARSGPVDLMAWYNFTTFDIIGDLAFGEAFGCLENSDYHPWVRLIFDMARTGNLLQVSSHFPWVRSLFFRLLSSKAARSRQESHRSMTREKLLRRIELGKNRERPDLIEGLLRKKDELGISISELERNASLLIIAGSETTATALAGITNQLMKNSSALSKLTKEVRSNFETEEEINFKSVNALPYLLACIEEGLRMYPPVAGGLPRMSPAEGATISGQYVPKDSIIAVHQWAMYHSDKHFKRPFEYHPERFLGDPEFESDHREAFQPFHLGPRNCLGRNLAYIEMKVILCRIIWNFDLTPTPENDGWMEKQKVYNLWEKGPLMVNLVPVQRA